MYCKSQKRCALSQFFRATEYIQVIKTFEFYKDWAPTTSKLGIFDICGVVNIDKINFILAALFRLSK